MSKRFVADDVHKAIHTLASQEASGDIAKEAANSIPVAYHNQIQLNTVQFGALQTFGAGILVGLEIANQRSTKQNVH